MNPQYKNHLLAHFDTLTLTPPMGWNSFNTFGCSPTQELICATADAMVTSGLRDAGYEYVNIDDGWMAPQRDENGDLCEDPARFPDGFDYLTRYVHDKGLKIGIYLGCGLRTYNEKPGSLGHERQDAARIARWGFDFLKYDNRPLPQEDPPRNTKLEYIKMAQALRASGRDIVFSMCEHGSTRPWTWAQGVGQLWRLTTDIRNMWDGELTGAWGFNKIVDARAELAPYARPGNFNDPDMLITGMYHANDWMGPGCTDDEYRAHFSLWCLMASPLIIGCDVRKLNDVTKETLTNADMIAIDQDILGVQGRRVRHGEDGCDVWVKPLSGVRWAAGLYNRTQQPQEITLNWNDLEVPAAMSAQVRDVWADRTLGVYSERLTQTVPPHSCTVLLLEPAL